VVSAAINPSWLAEVVAASPEALGFMMLEADPHAQLLDHATKLAAVSAALAEGTGTASALRARFPDLAPEGIARELGVPIETIDDDPAVGSLWRFAEYRERPARIVLYRSGLAPLDRAVGDGSAVRLLGQATPQCVFVAHELFHHIEATRCDIPMARRYRPTLFRIGRWHWRTGIATLSEIAAGGFAQSLLDLPCHPHMLDLVARDAIANIAATGLAGRIACAAARHWPSVPPALPVQS
jgi:hypothetical protein